MAGFKSAAEFCDVISHSAYCVDDATMMLAIDSTTNEFWIPSTKVQHGVSWQTELGKVTVDVSHSRNSKKYCLLSVKLINYYLLIHTASETCKIILPQSS